MFNPRKIEDLQFCTEKQILGRKSAMIKAVNIAIPVVAMANADGGFLAVGIEDDGSITGIDDYQENINELVRVPFDYCTPNVKATVNTLEVTDINGRANHVLLMQVFPSDQVIANQADEVFLRVGDKSKKLNFEQRLQLVYAKGVRYFEDQNVAGATIDDIDLDYVSEYCRKIGYTKGNAEYYLRHNNDFVTTKDGEDIISVAAILLFGKNPQKFFPRARVRFIRYEGTRAEVGDRMNVIKDEKFTGRIIDQVNEVTSFVRTQIREYTKLGKGGIFQTTPEYPEFCWMELIVNAIAHRDYSIMGTDIQVKMFDDHFLVESPGTLPGLVRINNIREYHFSRNPKIVELLNDYDLVKEFGEGVDRIYRDMEDAGLPEPEYRQSEFMLYATIRNKNWGKKGTSWRANTPDITHNTPHDTPHEDPHDAANSCNKIIQFCKTPRNRQEIMSLLGLSDRKNFYKQYLKPLLDSGKLKRTIPDKIQSKNQKYIAKFA